MPQENSLFSRVKKNHEKLTPQRERVSSKVSCGMFSWENSDFEQEKIEQEKKSALINARASADVH